MTGDTHCSICSHPAFEHDTDLLCAVCRADDGPCARTRIGVDGTRPGIAFWIGNPPKVCLLYDHSAAQFDAFSTVERATIAARLRTWAELIEDDDIGATTLAGEPL